MKWVVIVVISILLLLAIGVCIYRCKLRIMMRDFDIMKKELQEYKKNSQFQAAKLKSGTTENTKYKLNRSTDSANTGTPNSKLKNFKKEESNNSQLDYSAN